MNGITMNDESAGPEMNFESSSHADEVTKHIGDQFQDSGFFDADDSVAYDYLGDKDFILFNGSAPHPDQGYFLTDEDAIDIASTKASYGSSDNDMNNSAEPHFDANSAHNYLNEEGWGEEVVYSYAAEGVSHVEEEEEEEEDRPHHTCLSLPTTQPQEISPLEVWSMSFHRYESLAYRLDQPLNPSYVYQQLPMWDGDDTEIDL